MFGRLLVFGFIGLAVVIFVFNETTRRYFSYSGDAYVTTDVVIVSPTVPGRLVELQVERNQAVRAGNKLFQVDPEPYRLQLEIEAAALNLAELTHKGAKEALVEAGANVSSATAVLEDTRKTQERLAILASEGVTAQQRLDDINRDLAEAQAELDRMKAAETVARNDVTERGAEIASADAARNLARYRLGQTLVTAPVDGHVAPFTTRPGQYIEAGEAVLAVVSDTAWRVVVNLPEQHLEYLAPGQPAWILMSSRPWRPYRGTVRSVSRGVARSPDAPAALPYVAPTTEWIRLSRRFPVEIDFDDLSAVLPLFMGSDARVLILHGGESGNGSAGARAGQQAVPAQTGGATVPGGASRQPGAGDTPSAVRPSGAPAGAGSDAGAGGPGATGAPPPGEGAAPEAAGPAAPGAGAAAPGAAPSAGGHGGVGTGAGNPPPARANDGAAQPAGGTGAGAGSVAGTAADTAPGAGAGGGGARPASASDAGPDARTPDARTPDARTPDARTPDAPAPDGAAR